LYKLTVTLNRLGTFSFFFYSFKIKPESFIYSFINPRNT
jgi:hypothetical protein